MTTFEAWLEASPRRIRLFALFVLLTLPLWFALIAYVELRDSYFGRECRDFTVGVVKALREGSLRD